MRAGMNDTRTRCDACGVELGDGPQALLRNPSLGGGVCCDGCDQLAREGMLLCGGCLQAVGYADLWGTVFGWSYDLTWNLDATCAQRLWDARWMPDRMTVTEAECWDAYERRRGRTLVNRDGWDPRAFRVRSPDDDPRLARAMAESLGLDYDRPTMLRFRKHQGTHWDETDAAEARRMLGDA